MTSEHEDHSRKIALRCVEALERRWPNLCMEGFDIDEATDELAMMIPCCVQEAESAMAEMDKDEDAQPPPGPSLISQLRIALGLESGSIRTTLELAIERVKERGRYDA